MITIAIGWELYDRTGSALVLGGVGLAQVIPLILLSLPAGDIVDRYNRKLIIIMAQIALLLATLGLAAPILYAWTIAAHLRLPDHYGRHPILQWSDWLCPHLAGSSRRGVRECLNLEK